MKCSTIALLFFQNNSCIEHESFLLVVVLFWYTTCCLCAYLESIRCFANFTTDQAIELTKITTLRSLTLDAGTWNVVDVLPKWSKTLMLSLTSLTLTVRIALSD